MTWVKLASACIETLFFYAQNYPQPVWAAKKGFPGKRLRLQTKNYSKERS
jgi:hypothetical protein